MFDVKNLAKVLNDIFTRDNENLSPELVAEELTRRENDFMVKPTVYRYDHSDPASGQQQFKVESDPMEMTGSGAPSEDHWGGFVARIENGRIIMASGGVNVGNTCTPIGHSAGAAKNYHTCIGLGPECVRVGPATLRPQMEGVAQEQIHSEAVSWLSDTHIEWPDVDSDCVLVRKSDAGEWIIPYGHTLAHLRRTHVVTRNEWEANRPMNSIAIGNHCTVNHRCSILIGNNISSDKDYQLKIGNSQVECTRELAEGEFEEIRSTLLAILEKA